MGSLPWRRSSSATGREELPAAGQAARAGPPLPAAGLSRGRRDDPIAGRNLHRDLLSRAEDDPGDAHADRRRGTGDVSVPRQLMGRSVSAGPVAGDYHIHAAGCAHYTNPTEGILPKDMERHIEGEDLKIGCNLTWGPCFDYQKQFFTGKLDINSHYPYLLRYDIEVSGFGSHQSGHLCLLRLKDQIPPGGNSDKHWPTLCLNTLRWAKKQGAVCGPAHSANGLASSALRVADVDGPNGLPTYAIPRFDGIGAMETIADVTYELPGPDGTLVPAVDFFSTMDTDRIAELNIWYHCLTAAIGRASAARRTSPASAATGWARGARTSRSPASSTSIAGARESGRVAAT